MTVRFRFSFLRWNHPSYVTSFLRYSAVNMHDTLIFDPSGARKQPILRSGSPIETETSAMR